MRFVGSALSSTHLAHTGPITSAEWSPLDERLLATGSYDGTAILWDIEGAEAKLVLRHTRLESYAKPSLKKCRPIAARNEDKKVFSGRL